MPVDLAQLQQAIDNGDIVWRKHVLQRMAERNIRQKDALQIVYTGEIIRYYNDDRPFPSVLLFGWINTQPLHVVASYDDAQKIVYIITVYEPSTDVFEPDFKTRKQ